MKLFAAIVLFFGVCNCSLLIYYDYPELTQYLEYPEFYPSDDYGANSFEVVQEVKPPFTVGRGDPKPRKGISSVVGGRGGPRSRKPWIKRNIKAGNRIYFLSPGNNAF